MSKKKYNIERTLDLHGIRHEDVERMVQNYVFMTEYPHDIITGNSVEMHKIVKDILDEHKFRYQVGDIINQGYIRVLGY